MTVTLTMAEKEVWIKKVSITTVLPVMFYFVVLAFFAHSTDDNIIKVFVAMLPSFINILLLIFYDPTEVKNRLLTWLSPLVLALMFLIIWRSGVVPAISEMEGPVLAFVNLLLGYFMTLFFIVPDFVPTIHVHRTTKRDIASDLSSFDYDDESDITETGIAYSGEIKGNLNNDEDEKLQNALDEFERKSKYDEKEIDHLKKQLQKYQRSASKPSYNVPTRVVPQIYALRESVAVQRKKRQKEAEDLKLLRRMIAEYEILNTSDSERVRKLKKELEKYEKKVEKSTEEVVRLRETVLKYSHELKVTKKNVKTTLRSIEDKLKALNFVIGRVYSDKKGGSKEIRDMLKFPREWYNAFTAIVTHEESEEEPGELLEILHLIKDRLKLLERREADILNIGKAKLPVNRYKHYKILDVMATNDDDPSYEYHDEAKEICEKMIHYLKK